MLLVVDTNVIVSALLSPNGAPAQVVGLLFNGGAKLCYDARIIAEYSAVLARPRFMFDQRAVSTLLTYLTRNGLSVVPPVVDGSGFADYEDKKFYEVAIYCHTPLVTGNLKHFPQDGIAIPPSDCISLRG